MIKKIEWEGGRGRGGERGRGEGEGGGGGGGRTHAEVLAWELAACRVHTHANFFSLTV